MTEEIVMLDKAAEAVSPKKPRAKRKTFDQVREDTRAQTIALQRAHYEPLMAELAQEINALRDELDAARGTLQAVRGSWLAALRYRLRGEL
jgi:flagellar biosynthesis chaperone FliJ